MNDVLFLCQRIPYPPDKGDKIRSYQMLTHLAKQAKIHLACLVDDPDDWQYHAPLAEICASTCLADLKPLKARVKSLTALGQGAPLSKPYFFNRHIKTYVDEVLATVKPQLVFVFSSVMAQYVYRHPNCPENLIIDYVDVDSDKWLQYAKTKSWPMSWVYRREGRTLATFDREVGAAARAALFVSEPEAALFRQVAPELAKKTIAISNGVDTEYFSPDAPDIEPIIAQSKRPHFVFSGHMGYWPNVDAAIWFAKDILPLIRQTYPLASFTIAGAAPDERIKALGKLPGIFVTGRVPDMRPYILDADMIVAPMRIARGIQNKVLEGMAMGKTVLTTPQGLEGIKAQPDQHLMVAENAADLAAQAIQTLQNNGTNEMGQAARRLLVANYAWETRLAGLDKLIE